MESAVVPFKIPGKYQEHQDEKLNVPIRCTVWACADVQQKKPEFSGPQHTLVSNPDQHQV